LNLEIACCDSTIGLYPIIIRTGLGVLRHTSIKLQVESCCIFACDIAPVTDDETDHDLIDRYFQPSEALACCV